jgi:biotin/methionine sulfoxide reductase
MAMHKAIDPVGQARNDFDIFADLSGRLGCAEAYTQGRDEAAWHKRIYERWCDGARTNRAALPDFDTFWRDGYFEIPYAAEEYVLFADFRADPEKHRLRTPSGKIELYSERIAGFGYDDCPPHPTWMEPAEWLGATRRDFPPHLVSSQPRLRLHSQMDAGPVSARGKVAGREPTRARGIAAGDVVRVRNERGACFAGVVITDAVREGVVQLACGAWYDPADDAAGTPCSTRLCYGLKAVSNSQDGIDGRQ